MRSAQLRKAAADAFQWMEANEALKRAAGSRSRLPKLELLAEGAQVMFWEPPANRRGLSRRLSGQHLMDRARIGGCTGEKRRRDQARMGEIPE